MPSLYDRLSNQVDDDKPTGLTPLDIAGLPEDQRRVMFLLLRDPSSSADGTALNVLQNKLSDLEELSETLGALVKNGWVIVLGEPPNVRFKANLRRKRGSDFGLWASLSEHLTDEEDPS